MNIPIREEPRDLPDYTPEYLEGIEEDVRKRIHELGVKKCKVLAKPDCDMLEIQIWVAAKDFSLVIEKLPRDGIRDSDTVLSINKSILFS